MSGVIGVAGLTADYPAAPLGTFVLAALPEQDLKPADNQTVGERTQVQVAGSVLAYRRGGGCSRALRDYLYDCIIYFRTYGI